MVAISPLFLYPREDCVRAKLVRAQESPLSLLSAEPLAVVEGLAVPSSCMGVGLPDVLPNASNKKEETNSKRDVECATGANPSS
jgi:hypothetical protein